jgi:hypothetical protein
MAIGALVKNGNTSDVEIISLDPEKHPLPEQFKKLNPFPNNISGGTGGLLGQYKQAVHVLHYEFMYSQSSFWKN